MYDKHVNYLPFNRQAKSFERLGVNLSRSVLANWVNSAALLYLQPMFNRLHKELLKREVIMADETPCQVHKEDGRKNTSKSFMWIYRSGEDTLPEIILYDYQISRSGDHPIDFLNGFSGYLHCDGFSAYNRLTNVTRIACLAHIRRKFVEALPAKSKRVPKPVSEYTPAERGGCSMQHAL
ncbi:hypothetical protein M2145_000540 [Lachnospiraceae bacterium PF1-21]